MGSYAQFLFADKMIVLLSVIIVILAVATMIVVGSESLRNWFRKVFVGVILMMEAVADKWFSDDEDFNPEWMDRDAWERTRMQR